MTDRHHHCRPASAPTSTVAFRIQTFSPPPATSATGRTTKLEHLPATKEHGKRVDYEYERAGTCNIFMFTEPLAGWREVSVRKTKTKVDWAMEMARLLEVRYADCPKVILI